MTTVQMPVPEVPAGSSGTELPATAEGSNAVGARDRARGTTILQAIVQALTPIARKIAGELAVPDIARIDPPSLGAIWRRAKWGEQHPEDSVLRWLGYLYGLLVAMPISTGCYLAAWVAERPTRLAVAVTTGVCLTVVARAIL